MSGAAKKQAPRLARPAARYWKGKAPKGVVEVDSDSDEDENADEPQLEEEGDVLIGGEGIEIGGESDEDHELPTHAPNLKPVKAMNIALKDVNISTDGRVVVSGRDESGKTEMEEDEGMFSPLCNLLVCSIAHEGLKGPQKKNPTIKQARAPNLMKRYGTVFSYNSF